MRDRAKLEAVITKYAVPEFRDFLLDSIQQSIRLKPQLEQPLAIGQSKFGGCPDLPETVSWPTNQKGEAYTFLAQINLAEITGFDTQEKLPAAGILYFFFDWILVDDGCVLFIPPVENLQTANPPEFITRERKSFWQRILKRKGRNFLINEAGLSTNHEYYSSNGESLEYERLVKTTGTRVPRWSFMHEDVHELNLLSNPEEKALDPKHHLLGRYLGIHGEGVELLVAGIKTKFEKLSLEEIDMALQWKLLFQFDTDDSLNFQWGDSGVVYFFIHKDDLQKQDFSKVRVHSECY